MKVQDLVTFVIISGWVLLILSCLGVILPVGYHLIYNPTIDMNKELVNMANLAFGFLFGTLTAFIKDLFNQAKTQ